MQAADPLREIPQDWLVFEPVDFIPELQMLVQVFPYDRKLPNLRRVMGGGLGSLEPLLLARLGPGPWHIEQRAIEPMRYRTEMGAALKYTVKASETLKARSQTRRCYLKVYRDHHGEETFQLLRSLAQKTSAGQQPFSVVNPVAYLSELRTLVLEEAAGASLQDELLRIVKETGIRLVGPNSIGTVSTDPPMALTANAAFAIDRLRTGNWSLVSQSGRATGRPP